MIKSEILTRLKEIRAKEKELLALLNEIEAIELAEKIADFKARFGDRVECRTGHSTGSTNHRDWQSDDGEPWTFVVVRKDLPEIHHVQESSKHVTVTFTDGTDLDDSECLLGQGETEEEAWDSFDPDSELLA